MDPAAPLLEAVRHDYNRGLYLQAYERTRACGPLSDWQDPAARVMAARLAGNLGAPRLQTRLSLTAFRRAPDLACTRAYAAPCIRDRFGVLRLLEWLDRWDAAPLRADDDADSRHYLLCHRAAAACTLRDFAAAEQGLARADADYPGQPWTCVERAALLERQDRYEDALTAAREGLVRRPWFRPSVLQIAHLLQTLNREDEALELVEDAARRLESGAVAAHLAALHEKRGDFARAETALADYERLSPLMENEERRWLAARRGEIFHRMGRRAEASACFRAAVPPHRGKQESDPYYAETAARLDDLTQDARRVELPVPFVRQHWKTCAPATAAVLTAFWGRPVDHLELARDICYDGTPTWREREWAETHGWTVREFRLTWPAATALLDRGVPFAVSTVQTTSAHRQAIIGYDRLTACFLLREPSSYHTLEAIADRFLKGHAADGPEALVLLPGDRTSLLDGIDLPDAPLYDLYHRFCAAIGHHRRADAVGALAELDAAAPGHDLAAHARALLAGYDGNHTASLAAIASLRERHPDANWLRLRQINWQAELATREERLATLDQAARGPKSEPVFWQRYAGELVQDARRWDDARFWCRKAIRFNPCDAQSWHTLARLDWEAGHHVRAVTTYRIAADLDHAREEFAYAYFQAARACKLDDAALRHLQERYGRYGDLSGAPAITLFQALARLDRDPEAFELLEKALARRPDDADLILFAADTHSRYGRHDDAERLLQTARGRVHDAAWLAKAANLHTARGRNAEAQQCWLDILALDPLNLQAHNALAWSLAETEGHAAALAHLDAACQSFPHHVGLLKTRLELTRAAGVQATEAVVRRLLDIDPDDAWAWRELAWNLDAQGRYADAETAADRALLIDPRTPASHQIRGDVLLHTGRTAEARDCYRAAFTLSADYHHALHALLAACDSLDLRRQALAFAESELVRQTLSGDGLLAFRNEAAGILSPDELLNSLNQALAARPDLWHAWSAVTLQLVEAGRLDQALTHATDAAGRFPLLPRIWTDLAYVHQARTERSMAIEALRQALAISVYYSFAYRRLAALLEEERDLDGARSTLETGCRLLPLDAALHGCLAELQWKTGDREPALAELQTALRCNHEYDWAWDRLRVWGREAGRPDLAADTARELTRLRAGEAEIWMHLAEALIGTPDAPELHDAIGRAEKLQPRNDNVHLLRIRALALAGHTDKALAACAPDAVRAHGGSPATFNAQKAWVLARAGRLEDAVAAMRLSLDDDPSVYNRWEMLTSWYWDLKRPEEAIAAVEKMTRLAPLDPVPLGYMAALKEKRGSIPGAIEDYLRAIALDPNYWFAAENLFDIYFNREEFGKALRLLDENRNPAFAQNPFFLCRLAAAQAANRKHAEAWETLRAIARHGDPGENCAAHALSQILTRRPSRRRNLKHLRQIAAILASPAHPLLNAIAEQLRSRYPLSFPGWLRRVQKDAPANAAVMLAQALQGIGNDFGTTTFANNTGKWLSLHLLFLRLRRRHARLIRQHTGVWGACGYTFLRANRVRASVKLLSSWQQRPDAENWMLHNLSIGLRSQGRFRDALTVDRANCEKTAPDTRMGRRCRLWVALEHAWTGEYAKLRVLPPAPAPKPDEAETVLNKLARLLRDADDAAGAVPRQPGEPPPLPNRAPPVPTDYFTHAELGAIDTEDRYAVWHTVCHLRRHYARTGLRRRIFPSLISFHPPGHVITLHFAVMCLFIFPASLITFETMKLEDFVFIPLLLYAMIFFVILPFWNWGRFLRTPALAAERAGAR